MDAHKNEYDAAAAGMAETYGRPAPAVGDYVNGLSAGRRWAGYVMEVRGDRVAIDIDGAILDASLADITNL